MDARDFFGYKHGDEEPGRREEEPDDDVDELSPPPLDEAITLDDPAILGKIDPEGMLAHVAELPRQLAIARRVAAPVELSARHRDVDNVIVLGMGGSAIGAELAVAVAGDRLRVPLLTHRDYDLPAWVGERTLVIAASHSGETAETLAATRLALARNAPIAVITTGGSLAGLAEEQRLPLYRYGAKLQPRAAVGFGFGLLHELLVAAGLVTNPDPWDTAVATLDAILERNAVSVRTDDNAAKQLAWSLFGRIPILYGHGPMAAVAHRWKTQLNENAKAWASYEPMPEANHNAIEGSLNPRELGDVLYVLELRDPTEPEAIATRYRVVDELLGERATPRSAVWAEGDTPLARVLGCVAFGDLVTIYLAILYQTDPTPVTLLAMLKERLARASAGPTSATE